MKLCPGSQSFSDLESLKMAEAVIIKSFQRNYFPNELEMLVGSQIRNSVISEGIKHPMFLTRNDH